MAFKKKWDKWNERFDSYIYVEHPYISTLILFICMVIFGVCFFYLGVLANIGYGIGYSPNNPLSKFILKLNISEYDENTLLFCDNFTCYYKYTMLNFSSNPDCQNLSVFYTAECLKDQLSSWYKYNESNTRKELSFDEFKLEGGVCRHASEWYVNMSKSLGLNGIKISFFTPTEGHMIALIYDNNLTQYCILDQRSVVGCEKLSSVNQTVNQDNTINQQNNTINQTINQTIINNGGDDYAN